LFINVPDDVTKVRENRFKRGKKKKCSTEYPFTTSGVNFINVLQAAFMRADPESVKIQLSRQYLFMLMGSACTKDAHKTLMKLTLESFMELSGNISD
jgi:NAD-dependent oxidoreductase involved in siderophore biosynthesis